MNVLSCSCSCGNVQIKGKIVQFQMNPTILPSEKKSHKICKSLFVIQSSSIEMQNKKLSKKSVKRCQAINHIKCSECNTLFRFYAKDKKYCMERLQICESSQNNFNNENEKVNQYNDNSENVANNIDLSHIEDDCDFELMFSNKYCPLIGSYKNNLVTPIVGSLDNEVLSDFQQKSFLA